MNKIKEFIDLKGQLNSALKDGKYHLLLGLDQQIKDASVAVFAAIRSDAGLEKALVKEVTEVIELYRLAVELCTEQSERAKKELLKTTSNKQGAAQYLQVAGISYGNP